MMCFASSRWTSASLSDPCFDFFFFFFALSPLNKSFPFPIVDASRLSNRAIFCATVAEEPCGSNYFKKLLVGAVVRRGRWLLSENRIRLIRPIFSPSRVSPPLHRTSHLHFPLSTFRSNSILVHGRFDRPSKILSHSTPQGRFTTTVNDSHSAHTWLVLHLISHLSWIDTNFPWRSKAAAVPRFHTHPPRPLWPLFRIQPPRVLSVEVEMVVPSEFSYLECR